jgi:hypothetical protein
MFLTGCGLEIATLYIYTRRMSTRMSRLGPCSLNGGRCSCGGLGKDLGVTIRLTQMEVVVLCVAESNEATDNVDERYILHHQSASLQDVFKTHIGSTYASQTCSCQSIASGSVPECLCPVARGPVLVGASRRSSRPFACGQHSATIQWPELYISKCRE